MPEQTKHKLVAIFAHVSNSIATLLIAFFGILPALESSKVEEINNLYQANAQLRKEISQASKERVIMQIEIIQLRSELSDKYSRSEVLQMYLDQLPFPAWVKEYREDDKKFYMYLINENYTVRYGVTRLEYLGRTDHDIYEENMANRFEFNDFTVINLNQPIRKVEYVRLSDGKEQKELVIKFKISLTNGRIGVGGVSIPIEE